MAQEHFEKTPQKANRWFRAAIVLALLYGITFSLNAFFNWIFFFASAYAFFMSYYLLPVQPKIFQAKRRPTGNWTGPTQFATEATTQPTVEQKIKRTVFIIVGGFFGLMVMFFIIGILNPEEGQQQGEYNVEGEAESMDPQDLVLEGDMFYEEQNYDSAEFYYALAAEKDPSNMRAVFGRGIVAWQQERKEEAMAFFRQSYEGGFRHGWLSWVLAEANDESGNTAQAISLYKESVNLDSTMTDSYVRLAELEPANRDKYLQLAQKYANN